MMYLTNLRPLNQWNTEWTTAEAGNTAIAETTSFQPAISFSETAEVFTLRIEIPGIDPDSIELVLTNGELTIRGTKPEYTLGEGDVWHTHETTWGTFERTFTFNTPLANDGITAESKFGILTITIAKAPEAVARRIPITIK